MSKHALTKFVRRGVNGLQCFFVHGWEDEHECVVNSVFRITEPDINQAIYDEPQYVSALQSALLNQSATLFLRKYYLSGRHAGFIMCFNDAAWDKADIDAMRTA